MSVSGLGSTSNASNAFSNPELLSALLPGYNISALDEAMQTQIASADQPLTALESQETTLQTKISGWQSLQSALSAVQTDAQSLASPSLFQQVSVQSSNQNAVQAVATGSGNPGTYNVTVSNLMQPETVFSAVQSSGSSALGLNGSFSINGTSISVTGSTTLVQLAHDINATNAGVTALVLPQSSGYELSLSSVEAQRITWSDPNGILQSLGVLNASGHAFSSSGTGVQSGDTLPVEAAYTINGAALTSPTNSDSTSIPGVTLQFLAPTASNAPAAITVSQNTASVVSAVQQLATDYNSLLSTVNSLTGTSGSLGPNADVSQYLNTIDQTLGSVLPGEPDGYQSLSQIGVTISAPVGQPNNLTMHVNTSTLTQALESNPSAVQQLLSGTSGVATTLQQQLNAWVGASGSVPSEVSSLQNQDSTIASEVSNPNSAVNVEVNEQTQLVQQQFDQMLSALMSSVSQGNFLQDYMNQVNGSSNNSTSGGGS